MKHGNKLKSLVFLSSSFSTHSPPLRSYNAALKLSEPSKDDYASSLCERGESNALGQQQNPNHARQVFGEMTMKEWSSTIKLHAMNSMLEDVMKTYVQMRNHGILPDRFILPCVLKACRDLPGMGSNVHALIIVLGYHTDIVLGSALVQMYASAGDLCNARRVFDEVRIRDLVLWSSMIRSYSQVGKCSEALELCREMCISEMLTMDVVVASIVLSACAQLPALRHGRETHGYAIRHGFYQDPYVMNGIIDFYMKCDYPGDACQVFDKMPTKDGISWSSMVCGLAKANHFTQALELFRGMLKDPRNTPNSAAFASIISCFAYAGDLAPGKEAHGYLLKSSLASYDSFVGSALIDMYSKCGVTEDAIKVFDRARATQRDIVMWNSVIAGCAQNRRHDLALEMFRGFLDAELKPNLVTCVSLLPVCGHLESLREGMQIHAYALKAGFDDHGVVGSALIDMYGKCGNMDIAKGVFSRMQNREAGVYNRMIWGYAHVGDFNKAIDMLRHVHATDMKPDSITLSSILPVFAQLVDVQVGKALHGYVIRHRFEGDEELCLGNALVDMYAKCGIIELGLRVFERMQIKDIVTWNALIAGYGMHGHAQDALRLLESMQGFGIKPDHITFVTVLSACSHAGLVEIGSDIFAKMSKEHDLAPQKEHYACMVDILARAGLLSDAWDFVNNMPIRPCADIWGTLLGACRVHRNIELAEAVADKLFELEQGNPGYYVLLSNIYATAGRKDDVERVRKLMKERGIRKNVGCSWIEVNNVVHTFRVADRLHPQHKEIHSYLVTLSNLMKEVGYVPDTSFVMNDL